MAIKVRKRRDDDNETPEDEEQEESSGQQSGVEPTEGDPFMRGSMQTISWFAENQTKVYGGIAALIVIAIGAYVVRGMQRQQAVRASEGVSAALEAFDRPVKGSPIYEAITNPRSQSRDGIQLDKTFEDEKEKWNAVYSKATKTIDEHASSAAVQPARLAKAAAAARLGKYDESLKLYQAYLDGKKDVASLPMVHYGMAVAYAEKGDFEKAVASMDELAKTDKEYKSFALYHQGVFMEEAGNAEKAKELYNKALENDPETPYKTDIERRIALL